MALFTPLLVLYKNSKSLKSILTPGLVSSLLLSFLFVFMRKVRPFCRYLPQHLQPECTFEWGEVEMFFFFICVMAVKNRTSISIQQMITKSLMYAKIVNTVLFYRVDPRLSVVYFIACIVRVWLFPENFVDGPEELTYFSDKTLKETLEEDAHVTWIVEFYTTWSPPCHAMMPVFAALSNEYTNDYLRFGKIDLGKYPEAAQKYGVSTSTLSQQLPTVIVFENGEAVNWRPMIGPKKKFIKYVFSEQNIKRDFELDKLYEQGVAKSKKFKKSGKTKKEE